MGSAPFTAGSGPRLPPLPNLGVGQTGSWPGVKDGLAAQQMPYVSIWKLGEGSWPYLMLCSPRDLCRHVFVLFAQPDDQDLIHSEISDRSSNHASVCEQTLTWCRLFVREGKMETEPHRP